MSINPEYFYPTIITNITSLNGGIFGTVKGTDVYPAVDVTDVTQSPTGTTKPYQIIQLANFILGSFGFIVYAPVLAATTANLTATYANGPISASPGVGATLTNSGVQSAFTLDGQAGILNGRYLVSMQSSSAQNGIYQLTYVGDGSSNWILTRTADFNQPSPPPNIQNDGIVYVQFGTTYGNTYWQDTFTAPLTVGTTSINWDQWVFNPDFPTLTWEIVTSAFTDALPNYGYRTDRTGTPAQIQLPATFNLGDEVIILGNGSGGWNLLTNVGQTIKFGSVTANNSINSDIQDANITVRGLIANTTWQVVSVNSNPSYS